MMKIIFLLVGTLGAVVALGPIKTCQMTDSYPPDNAVPRSIVNLDLPPGYLLVYPAPHFFGGRVTAAISCS